MWNEPEKDGFGDYCSPDDKPKDRKTGISRREILNKHYVIYGRPLSSLYLRQNILPQLEQAGLIAQEKSLSDGREMLVIPLEINIEGTDPKDI